MAISHRHPHVIVLFFISFFMPATEAAELDIKRQGQRPPSSYHINDTNIRVTLHPGSPAFSIKWINLSAKGGALLERDGATMQLSFAHPELLKLVNELYKMRFFELPSDYIAEYSIVQKDDGTLVTMISSTDDEPSTSVCIQIKEYKKCIIYGRKGPRELANLVDRIFTEVDKQLAER